MRSDLAINRFFKDRGFKIGTLIAFSGEVNDKESGLEGFVDPCMDFVNEAADILASSKT